MFSKTTSFIAACALFAGLGLASDPASAQWRRGDAAGAAVAGGIIGLATGAMIGAAANQPPVEAAPEADAEYIAYCARKYRSFDPASGTFLSRDGNRYPCQMP